MLINQILDILGLINGHKVTRAIELLGTLGHSGKVDASLTYSLYQKSENKVEQNFPSTSVNFREKR